MKAITHKDQELTYHEWLTWDNKPASGWTWKTTLEQRREMPWLPVSCGGRNLDEAKAKVDWYLDPARADQYRTTQLATAAWVAEGRAKGYNND